MSIICHLILSFIYSIQDRLSDEMSRDLLAQCKGNPLSIHLIKVIAEQGYAAVSDMSSPLLESLLTDSLDSVTQRLLSGTFDELSPSQKETLLTVALYEGVAQLGSICKVIQYYVLLSFYH